MLHLARKGDVSPMRLTLLPLFAAFAGCVPYPIYKTLQPEAEVTVHDSMARPIQGARVTLISSAYPHGLEKSRETKETDAWGVAKFDSRKEWRTEIMMIHGAEVYFWNWCVERPGLVTYASAGRSADSFYARPTIVLAEGASTPCPRLDR